MPARKALFQNPDGSVLFDTIHSTDLPASPPPGPPSGAGGSDGQLQFNRQGALDGTTCAHWDYANGALVITGGQGAVTPGTFGLMVQYGVDGTNRAFLGNADSAAMLQGYGRSLTLCGAAGAIGYTPANSSNWGGTPPTDLVDAVDRLAASLAGSP